MEAPVNEMHAMMTRKGGKASGHIFKTNQGERLLEPEGGARLVAWRLQKNTAGGGG